MKITRNICGTNVEIELTMTEALGAYDEMRKYNVREMLNERLMLETDIEGVIPKELFDKLVKEVMSEQDALDENMGSNVFPAMEAVIRKNADALGKYKKEPYKLFEIEYVQTRKQIWSIRARNHEEADLIFHIWRDNHLDRYDADIADGDVEDTCGYLKEVAGNPDTAEIQSVDL